MADRHYPIVIKPLSAEDGGGFLAVVPDLYGCMSDGETEQEAVFNVLDAIEEWIDEATRLEREIPSPGSAAKRSMERYDALVETVEKQDKLLNHELMEIRRELEALKAEIQDSWVNTIGCARAPVGADLALHH